jgi:hypothetical protein
LVSVRIAWRGTDREDVRDQIHDIVDINTLATIGIVAEVWRNYRVCHFNGYDHVITKENLIQDDDLELVNTILEIWPALFFTGISFPVAILVILVRIVQVGTVVGWTIVAGITRIAIAIAACVYAHNPLFQYNADVESSIAEPLDRYPKIEGRYNSCT